VSAYDGPAQLLWWANRSFAMACEITVIVTETGAGWEVKLDPATEDDAWAVQMFPNPWELVFPDGSRFDVVLSQSSGEESLVAVEAN